MKQFKGPAKQRGFIDPSQFAKGATSAAGGGLGGILGSAMSFINPLMPMLGGLGSIFGFGKQTKAYDEGREDILNLPGMSGPENLFGSWGASSGGGYTGSLQSEALRRTLGDVLPGLFQRNTNPQLAAAMQNLGLGDAASGANNWLSQVIGPMNQNSLANMGALFGGGMGNLAAAGDSSGLQQQELDIMRQRFAPEAQRMQNQMFDRMGQMGLLGPKTDVASANSLVRGTQQALTDADFGFQQAAFDRGMQRQGFLANLGMGQLQQGMGMENQAWTQALGALNQNQNSAFQRLNMAKDLFSLDQDVYNQNFGMGIKGADMIRLFDTLGLDASAMPFELQARLLGSSGAHAGSLADIAKAKAESSGSFFGGLFG